MLNKKFQRNTFVVSLFSTFLTACTPSANTTPDVSSIQVTVSTLRFENDFFNLDSVNTDHAISLLRKKYKSFADLFLFNVTTLGSKDSILTRERVKAFIHDPSFKNLYEDVKKTFPDFIEYDLKLVQAFKYYKYYFPQKIIPQTVTFISAFSYPVITDSLFLGVSLDMYMGDTYKFYNTLQPPLPDYLRKRMRKEYLICDVMKGWAMSDYNVDESSSRIIDIMLTQGKILFFLDKVLPFESDTLKYGYSKNQLTFCANNESMIWSFLIDQDLLYSSDPNAIMKYVNDGPTTNGFPNEAPGNIAQFIGKQIINAYMQNNSAVTLQQLMENTNFDDILAASKYKPKK